MSNTLTAGEAFGSLAEPIPPILTLAGLVRAEPPEARAEPPAPIVPRGSLSGMEREHRMAQIYTGLDDLLADINPLLSADDRQFLIADFQEKELAAFLHGNYRRRAQDPEPAKPEERDNSAMEGGET